jgi:ABC-type multidrug transport system fused ATPase/permease subunit
MAFIMNGLDAESYDRKYTDRQLINRIKTYFRPESRKIGLVTIMVVLNSMLDAALPILVATWLDRIVGPNGVDSRVWWLVAAIIVFGAAAWGAYFVRQSKSAEIVGNIILRLRTDAIDAVMKRDMSFFDEYSSGRIVSRVTSDTQDFSNTVTLVMALFSQVLLVFIVTAVLFVRSPQLTLLVIVLIPIIIAIALGFRKVARQVTIQSQRVQGEVNGMIQETMRGIAVAKSYRQEATIYREFEEVSDRTYRIRLKQGFIFSGIFPLLFAVAGLGTTALVWVGGNQVIDGNISAGDWYLFLQAVGLFWFPLTSIASFWSQFQQGLSAAERVFALIDAEARVIQTDDVKPARLSGKIEFRNVTFGYKDERPVLEDFSLTIAPGETVALVGHTGAGKSTLGRLISRFYEFQGGQILIDDQDIRTFDLGAYRRQLGIVPQLPFLFSGTVADNIRYALPDATPEQIDFAASHIGQGDWVDALQGGLGTPIGEEGRGLSMGQRQLVALARVLIQDPAIIILDEATASVDPLTEAQIQEGLATVMAGRTSIVIAHRLSTIREVDRIIVLDHGKIVEEGNHIALMQAGGRYAELYNTYFRHQSPDYKPGEGFVTVNKSNGRADGLAPSPVPA